MGTAYPTRAIVVPFGPSRHQPIPSKRTDLGCKMVADGCFGGLPEGSQSTISLQMAGSAYGIRTRVTAVRGRRPRPLDECATQVEPPDDAAAAAAN